MNSRTAFVWATGSILGLVGLAATAVEPLSTSELAEHCAHYEAEPEGADAVFCVRYVQGFIDGAVATDERVALNVAAEYEEKETFTQRAIRTRAPQRSVARFGPTVYADFCIGGPVPLREVVEHVIGDLMAQNPEGESAETPASANAMPLARDTVYTVLRRDYPCVANDDE